MAYIDQNSQQVIPGRQIGRRGGEGIVHEALSHKGHVVKFYHQPPDALKAAKLAHMIATGTAEVLSFAAWPRMLVWDPKGNVRGFLMPVVQGKEIHELYGTKERFLNFPNARWDFLIHVARNCASAFEEIHKTGAVIGDVNEGNLLVKRDGTVCIIDCDSFQARASNGYLWTCDVGIAHWTAPELQGKTFSGLERSVNHDLFGLAVLIFRILFMGRHPYAGIPLTHSDLPLEKAIAEFRYAYSEAPQQMGVKAPPNTLPMSTLPSVYRDMFSRAFMHGGEQPGRRPSASEWVSSLDALRATLAVCKRDPTHKHPSHLSQCPWCQIADNGGPSFFISVHVQGTNGHISVELWEAIGNISPLAPAGYSIHGLPNVACSPEQPEKPESVFRGLFLFGVALACVAVIVILNGHWLVGIALALLGAGFIYEGPYLYSFGVVWQKTATIANERKKEIETELRALQNMEEQARRVFVNKKEEYRKKYERLIHLEQEKKAEIARLNNQKRQLQLDAFLDRQLLTKAKIRGVGPKLTSELLSYGIETALDVTNAQLVPGVGPTKYQELLRWRASCESRFRFDANAALPATALNQMHTRFASIRQTIESELRQAPMILQRLNHAAGAVREPITSKIEKLNRDRCQLLANLSVIPDY
jgi:DNA-binding helix-hairpin-helix protein with protein kinase domain